MAYSTTIPNALRGHLSPRAGRVTDFISLLGWEWLGIQSRACQTRLATYGPAGVRRAGAAKALGTTEPGSSTARDA